MAQRPYGFYDDMWQPTVYAGKHSQLVEINTKQIGGDADRNAGIFQSVSVQPGVPYELSLKGMIRADDHGGDPWRYRVFVGFDYNGGANWSAVSDWRELPWDTYYPRLSPGSFSSYSTKVTPTTGRLTVFVRLQRKWGDWYEETDLNLDAISLFGPVAIRRQPIEPPIIHPPIAETAVAQPPPVVAPPVVQTPISSRLPSCCRPCWCAMARTCWSTATSSTASSRPAWPTTGPASPTAAAPTTASTMSSGRLWSARASTAS